MDQTFSVLAKLFKESEMRTVDELIQTIQKAPLVPRPECRSLFFIYNWKDFIKNKFAGTPLEFHSFYHSFKFSKEDGKSKFRCKLFPQDTEYLPPTGIQLIKDGTKFEPVGSTDFRIEKLELEKVFRSLQTYLATLPLHTRMTVSASWEALRKTLESLPRRKENLVKMKISDLPHQILELAAVVPEHFEQFINEEEVPAIRGEVYPEKVSEDTFNKDVAINADVVVYTKTKLNRPWVGRVKQHLPGNMFSVQWFKRRGRGNTFHAMVQTDGSPFLSTQDNAVVMFWHICQQDTLTETSFKLSNYWLEKINQEYADHDAAYE